MDDAGEGRRGLKPTLTGCRVTAVHHTWGLDLAGASPLGGSTGLNLAVSSASGRCVVRVHRRHVTAARVEALQLARQAAASAGVPTAHTITGLSGERHVTVDGCVVEVDEYIESDAPMDTLARLRKTMPMFARLHDALGSAQLPDAADDRQFGNHLSATEMAARTAQGVRRIRALDPSLHLAADLAEALAGDVVKADGELRLRLQD